MEKYDVLVVGSGSGMMIAEAAVNSGLKTCLVEMGKLGGTCLNRGCIPSKMVIYPADLVNIIKHAERLGVSARIEAMDFEAIMERARRFVENDRRPMEEGVGDVEGLTFIPGRGEFSGDHTMKVGDRVIYAENIFLVTGSRPLIPQIRGLDGLDYLTSDNVWDLRRRPNSIIIVGGGLIACEMAHFFSAMGTETTILSRSPRLLKNAEPEVSEVLTANLRQRMHVETGIEVTEAWKAGDQVEVKAVTEGGEKEPFTAERLLIAAGRRSNADLLKPEKTGVQLDPRGYIQVNENYETTRKRIWAFGDAIGRAMYKHVANKEAEVVWHGFREGHFHPLDYDKVPYAVFTWPQVAGVGLTEEEASGRGLSVLVGEYNYIDTAKGAAMEEEDGFVKVILEEKTYRLLGAHIVGAHAPILIQELVNVMYAGDGSVYPVADAMHIHPALPEVVQRAVYNLREPGHIHTH
ncbi:dihydrolipoyl dehydrogenase [Candidatus Bathyarchaeota archaeon]|nr:dihydrolipoyl dehydrogenase [Candidatus Bathyarchaeota archaeon]